jgi:hypothetical protein
MKANLLTSVLLILGLLIPGIEFPGGPFWIWALRAVARWGLQHKPQEKRQRTQSRRRYACKALPATSRRVL